MSNEEIIYCFDTSAFIDAWRRYYSPELAFCKPVWAHIEHLLDNNRIIISEEVLRELEDQDDEIYKFVKKYPHIVEKVDESQIDIVAKILSTHGQIIDKSKTEKNHADVWVIALAKIKNATVVSFEGDNKGFGIPAVCRAYSVSPLKFQDFLKQEGC